MLEEKYCNTCEEIARLDESGYCLNCGKHSDNMTKKTLLENAKEYAIRCHADTNHKYDYHPYSKHLEMVLDVAYQFIDLIPEEDRELVLSACWCHDTIEDTRQTPNDVTKATNLGVAKIVYAVTNEKGWARIDRANDVYYYGIKDQPYATFVKLCDRIANIEYSKSTGSSMFTKYKKENVHFLNKLWTSELQPMWDYIDQLFTTEKIIT